LNLAPFKKETCLPNTLSLGAGKKRISCKNAATIKETQKIH